MLKLLCTVLVYKFIKPTDTSYLFKPLGQLQIKSLWDRFQKDESLLKGNQSTKFFVTVFAPNLPVNINKKVK
jgi:hypothetical protein